MSETYKVKWIPVTHRVPLTASFPFWLYDGENVELHFMWPDKSITHWAHAFSGSKDRMPEKPEGYLDMIHLGEAFLYFTGGLGIQNVSLMDCFRAGANYGMKHYIPSFKEGGLFESPTEKQP